MCALHSVSLRVCVCFVSVSSAHATGTVEMSRVYIGRLSYRAREKDVEKFFKGYGKILEVDLKNG